jgi:hypothetical protein
MVFYEILEEYFTIILYYVAYDQLLSELHTKMF